MPTWSEYCRITERRRKPSANSAASSRSLSVTRVPRGGFGRGLDGEVLLARRHPARAGVLPGAPREHLHFGGDDERAVEADAELADQGAVGLLVAGEPVEELLGAGLGDGAEIGDHFVAAHADAVVGDRDRAGVLVEVDDDAEVRVVGDQRFVGERLEAQPVDGVGGVRDELAQEDVPVGVQGVDHQLEELLGFGLEAAGFLLRRGGVGGGFCGHGRYRGGSETCPTWGRDGFFSSSRAVAQR